MSPSAPEISDQTGSPDPSHPGLAGAQRGSNATNLRVVHLLRKCNPREWGGTEAAIQRLVEGLRAYDVRSVIYCPRLATKPETDPLARCGCEVKRFRAFLPILGIPRQQRQEQIAIGGNLLSFDLPGALLREQGVSVLHSHALGRLGSIALMVAKRRRIPFVVTIHGGVLDLPESLKKDLNRPAPRGLEWGKAFGLLLRSREMLHRADAILTCNPKEAGLLRQQLPDRHIVVQPHGVALERYLPDHRQAARAAFPQIQGRQVLLSLGRIDPVKNQRWLVEQAPALFQRHPKSLLVLAGACTHEGYGDALNQRIAELGLADRVLLTGGLPPEDPRLIGLLQEAHLVLLSSVSETFGLVVLEAWAAGTAVVSSRTSGASTLIQDERNGWLFDLDDPQTFHEVVNRALDHPAIIAQAAEEGQKLVRAEYDSTGLAGRMKNLYEQLIEEKNALRDSPR
jgi:alpha-maltose-1-phosphate synthase